MDGPTYHDKGAVAETFGCFHVTRQLPYSPQGRLDVGQTLEVGNSHNPFFQFYENARTYPVTLATGQVIKVPAIKFLASVQSGEVTPNNLPAAALEVAKHYLMLARELIFEEVRLVSANASSLSSRKSCLWASDTLDRAQRWAVQLGGQCQILRLSVSGLRHVADSNLLLGDSEPLSETYQKAALYWQGGHSDNPELETLISGEVTVLEAAL